eukprot:Plantae.Rhodophyta-Hildenbrandia_rubra.ctg36574.p1 GENE.Plantae.Rhodophyta-Hildenbrandia_rubra.ctg36574~~Plantae.Rhodophyta-Hildenbrandia_rubra.ctg36574.p1  ORF type:complete len:528 (-),score=108.51 Plantae.Rhodophyta-Hildenbrandia_rubra.ctg36574:199-1782(-)
MSLLSHYEELGVQPTATPDEIRSAYRQAALVHHPDKNRDDPEAAARFQRIQQAYAVLSNDHERAWYDSQQQKRSRTSTVVDITGLMNDEAYEGFGQGKTSFWNVYGQAFDSLMQDEYNDDEPFSDDLPPRFGNQKSQWEDVKRFYGWWEGFTTKRSFEEADKWNLADARSRYERRAMEKENNKERGKEKKLYITKVKDFVAWVKRRDTRVKERRQMEQEAKEKESRRRAQEKVEKKKEREETLRNKSKASEDALDEDAEGLDEVLKALELDEEIAQREQSKAAASRRQSYANGAEYDHDDEDELASSENEIVDVETEDDNYEHEEDRPDDFYCIACKKLFRSTAQLRNHENSKKHKQIVSQMRKNLVAEDEGLRAERDKKDSIDKYENGSSAQTPEEIAQKNNRKRSKKRSKKQRNAKLATMMEDNSEIALEVVDDDHNVSTDGKPGRIEGEDRDSARCTDDVEEGQPGGDSVSAESAPKKNRKKRRRNKREKGEEVIRCNVCREAFASKTKLFTHVREFGHAMRVE